MVTEEKTSNAPFWRYIRLTIATEDGRLFIPHPNLSDDVNRNIVQSEIEGGVFLRGLAPNTVLQIRTQNHDYTAVIMSNDAVLLSGHPRYCPKPTQVVISGSNWGGSMLKQHFVGRGMRFEFYHPDYRTPIVTSSVQEIRECPKADDVARQAVHECPVPRAQ